MPFGIEYLVEDAVGVVGAQQIAGLGPRSKRTTASSTVTNCASACKLNSSARS